MKIYIMELEMNTQPLISIIVPIYMIDRYLGICIESLMNQTYRDIEIILVDDGSRDRCPEICDLYASKDPRIRVVHKENGGLVSARKAGLKVSQGSLVTYVDGDDWAGPRFIEELYNAYLDSGADIVCGSQTRVIFDQEVRLYNALDQGVYDRGDGSLGKLQQSMMSYGTFYRPGITTYVWNKLFKREILWDVQMKVDDRISIGEDAAVTYPAFLKCDRIAVTDNTEYHYRQREDSMLKQNSGFASDAVKLKYLYEYLRAWEKGAEQEYGSKMTEELRLREQITDFVLSISIMRSGGRLPEDDYSTFDKAYFGKNVVIYSAGTFGQQLVSRFSETGHCRVVGWIDDDYREYRRCCMNVDPVEQIEQMDYDYVLIASVDEAFEKRATERLGRHSVNRRRILTVTVPGSADRREELVRRFLYGSNSHS